MTEKENEVIETIPKNMFVPICITQAVCVAVIIVAVLIIKLFFNSSFAKLQIWYVENILDETNTSEIFEEENYEI